MPPLHLVPFPPSTGIASIDRLSCECRNFWVDDQSGRRTDRFFIGIVHLRKFNRIIDATSNGACLHAALNYSLYFLPTNVHTFQWRFVSRQDIHGSADHLICKMLHELLREPFILKCTERING